MERLNTGQIKIGRHGVVSNAGKKMGSAQLFPQRPHLVEHTATLEVEVSSCH